MAVGLGAVARDGRVAERQGDCGAFRAEGALGPTGQAEWAARAYACCTGCRACWLDDVLLLWLTLG